MYISDKVGLIKSRRNKNETFISMQGVVAVQKKRSFNTFTRDIGTICADGWGSEEAEVACRMIQRRYICSFYNVRNS